jgi:hypothetical protein
MRLNLARETLRHRREALTLEVAVEGERALDTPPAHELEAHPVDERDLPSSGREQRRDPCSVKFLVHPDELEGREQVLVQRPDGAAAEAPLHERRRLEDDVAVGDELLPGRAGEEASRLRVACFGIREESEERRAVD